MSVSSFSIKNGSSDFLLKQKALFDVLSCAEQEKKSSDEARDEFMEVKQKSNKRKRKETKQFKGKESLFKEPVDLPLRLRRSYKVPDFQRNPHKWTKYSLADVTQDKMSNESNTAAALAFLRDVKIQKKQQRAVESETNKKIKCENQKIPSSPHQFHLRVKQEEEDSVRDSEVPVFKSSKLIMPEYVVGQPRKVNKVSKKKILSGKTKEIYLNHIHEYEDE